MRRADRLFQIIQILRRAQRPITAAQLARELEISQRSVYRDIADLIGQHVPIRGEAGIGYVLGREFDMPPLMLTPDELEAAVLGAQWVADRGDRLLARAAQDLIAKIAAIVPDHLRPFMTEPSISVPPLLVKTADGLDIAMTREWIRAGRKVRILYKDEQGRETERLLWPTLIGYADRARLLVAWCELRDDFRHFRTDRILSAEFLDAPSGCRPRTLRARWHRAMALKRATGPL